MVRTILTVASAGALALVVAVAMPETAEAQSRCKGLSNSQCTSSGACSWVKGYTTKAGKSVSAHCRSNSAKSSRTSDKKS